MTFSPWLGCTLALIATPIARAELTWSRTTVEISATSQDKTVQADFPFRNGGAKTVAITGLDCSCHCTTAVPDHWKVAPGAKDIIHATFWVGGRTGRFDEWIQVATDGPDAARLHLIVDCR